MNTKQRILDTAEKLFAHNGIEATSLRAITASARVNLAAVNYHFRSKEALVHSVIARRMDPINQRRLAMLDACEAAAGDGPLPLSQVLEAFLSPVMEANATHGSEFGPIMGRIYTEPEFAEKFFKDHLQAVSRRFVAAFHRALPELPRNELIWRIHFMVGVMAHAVGAGRLIVKISEGACDPSDVCGLVRRMEAFLIAGFQAPVADSAKC